MPTKITEVEGVTLYENHPTYEPIKMLYYPNSHAYKISGDKKLGVTTVTGIINKESLAHWFKAEAIKHIRRALVPMDDGVIVAPESLEELEEILKAAGTASNAKGDKGKDFGTKTHAWLEAFLHHKKDGDPMPASWEKVAIPDKKEEKYAGKPYEYQAEKEWAEENNNIAEALENFLEWWAENDIEVVDIERIIYSKKYDYSGRFDCILRINGKLYLVDFKTNNPTWEYPQGVYPEVFSQLGAYDTAYNEEFYYDKFLKNESCFDGHLVLNFSKKSGKFAKAYSFDVIKNRAFWVYTLGTKRGMQFHIRNLSTKYKENRPERKKK